MKLFFEKLRAYELALEVAQDIAAHINSFPRGHGALSDQLRRASMSISANIAEGVGRGRPKDRQQFYLIARGSAHECVPFLQLAHDQNIISGDEFRRIKGRLALVSKMITSLIAVMEFKA